MKKIIGALVCFAMILFLSGCGEKAPSLLDENGEWHHYTEEEIQTDNYYILKDDGMYYQLLDVPTGEDSLGTLYSWFCEPMDAAIPHFTNKDKLMYYSDTTRPSTVTFYKMTDYAYTLGIMFKVTDNTGDLKHPQIIEFANTYNPQSQVGNVVNSNVTPNATTYITGINNHEFTGNLLVDDSFLKGLTKDTMYQLEIYCGTVRKTFNIKADTHLFLQEATYTTSAYEELKSKVFEIYMPQNLAPGYYYADGIGMFYYEGTIADLDDDDIEDLLEKQDQDNPENADNNSQDSTEPEASSEPDQVLNDLSVNGDSDTSDIQPDGQNTGDNTDSAVE